MWPSSSWSRSLCLSQLPTVGDCYVFGRSALLEHALLLFLIWSPLFISLVFLLLFLFSPSLFLSHRNWS